MASGAGRHHSVSYAARQLRLPTSTVMAPVAPAKRPKLAVSEPPGRGDDPELDKVTDFFTAPGNTTATFARIIRTALDEVIATSRTGRWNLDQCNDQEKAYVGVNLENIVRAEFDFNSGAAGMDFAVDGVDVDCKWSRNFNGWQIPKEAVGHICLLVYGDDLDQQMAVGLLRIADELLVGGNRDLKRTIQSPGGVTRIRWLVERGQHLPENFLMSLRREDRDAILQEAGGDARARELFVRCEGMILQRHTLESVGQQVDEGRRFRGETRAALRQVGFEVLNGHWLKHRERARALGGPVPQNSSEWVCLRTDGSSLARRAAIEPLRRAEAVAYRQVLRAELRAAADDRREARKAKKVAELEALIAQDEAATSRALVAADRAASQAVRSDRAPGDQGSAACPAQPAGEGRA